MYGTHCKHCLLIPPLVFNDNLALLRCGYMCAGTLVHISRHQGKTSNNNKRCQLWIRVCFAMFACIGFYFIFSVSWLLYYTCSHPALPLVFYSTSLLLLAYHTMNILYLISIVVYLLAPTCLCSWHGFQCMFMIQIYRYTCAYLYSPSDFCIITRAGSSDSSGSSCPGFGAWSVWILSVADPVSYTHLTLPTIYSV